MAERLSAPWLTTPETIEVLSALEAARPGASRFVGGCVRNTLMDWPVDDIDIATQIEPQAVLSAFETAGVRAIPTGIEHGTITAVSNGVPFEITTLRRDVETDGRRAVVAFTEDWAEDAARRDFRLNALYAEPDGTLHDPTGGGLKDAAAGRVIFIGDADERLREDYLRILRFFRFNAWYGADMDGDGLAACARQKSGLQKIAAERIWKEFEKLLRAPLPWQTVENMETSGVLSEVLPQARDVEFLSLVQSKTDDPIRRLMGLLPRNVEAMDEVSALLRLPNAAAERLRFWGARTLQQKLNSNQDYRAEGYRHGQVQVLDELALDPHVTGYGYHSAEDYFQSWQVPQLPVRGQDLLDLGYSGPKIGETLRDMEARWIASDFSLTRSEILSLLPR